MRHLLTAFATVIEILLCADAYLLSEGALTWPAVRAGSGMVLLVIVWSASYYSVQQRRQWSACHPAPVSPGEIAQQHVHLSS